MENTSLTTDRAQLPEIALVQGHGKSLNSLSPQAALNLLRERHAVLFRGFESDREAFVAFSDRVCYQFMEHGSIQLRPSRSHDGTVAEVLVGQDAVSLHAEMNYAPSRPDVLWFHCSKPPARGGETLLADSRRVLAALPDATRRAFESRRIRYRYVVRPEDWQRMAMVDDREQVLQLLNLIPDTLAAGIDDNCIRVEFTTEAIRPTTPDGKPGFINSIENVLEYIQLAEVDVRFEDEARIEPALLEDIGRAARASTLAVAWQAGDVLLVDNMRLMHGRASFEGERRIDVRFGLVADWSGVAT